MHHRTSVLPARIFIASHSTLRLARKLQSNHRRDRRTRSPTPCSDQPPPRRNEYPRRRGPSLQVCQQMNSPRPTFEIQLGQIQLWAMSRIAPALARPVPALCPRPPSPFRSEQRPKPGAARLHAGRYALARREQTLRTTNDGWPPGVSRDAFPERVLPRVPLLQFRRVAPL